MLNPLLTKVTIIEYPQINSLNIRDHSKMTSPQNCQILDPPPPMSLLDTFFVVAPPPYVTRQIKTNFSLDQRPSKIILNTLYN